MEKLVDMEKMTDEQLFKLLDEKAAEIREKNFIRPLSPRRKKLYVIATEEFRQIKNNKTGDSGAERN